MSAALRPLLMLCALCASGAVVAQDESAREGGSGREDAGMRVRQVERDGGRVLQAEPMQRGGREVYRLKVLTPEGRVRVLDSQRLRDQRAGGDPGSGSPSTRHRERALVRDREAPLPTESMPSPRPRGRGED